MKCQIQHGAATFAFVASPSQAEQLAPILGNGFAQGAVEARRASLGLIVASQVPADLPTNGARLT